jgi:hypothetical protein
MKELYLVAYYNKRPRSNVNTTKPGWMLSEDNYQYDERVEFAKGIKQRDISMAGVILNIKSRTVVKNTFNPSQKDFVVLFKYFLEAYPEHSARALADLDPDYLEQLLPKNTETVK